MSFPGFNLGNFGWVGREVTGEGRVVSHTSRVYSCLVYPGSTDPVGHLKGSSDRRCSVDGHDQHVKKPKVGSLSITRL